MILAVDTTHESGSVALVENGKVLEERTIDGADGFGHLLFEAISGMGVPMDRIDGFAAACGPGTFTGVRIGLTAVKGLGEAMGKPVYGVSNLEALRRMGRAETVVPFYDARRGDVYAKLPDGSEVVMPLEQVQAKVIGPVEWISFEAVDGMEVTVVSNVLAGAIGRIAEQRWLAGERPDPAALDANYVRRTDAELNWREA